MQLLAIALASSLVFGPAPVDASTAEAPPEVEPTSTDAPLPDVEDSPGGELEPEPSAEVEAQPEVEPEPEPAPEPPPPAVEQPDVAPSPAPAAVKGDRLGCDGSPACRRMTIAGIVVGTLGLGAVGAGIGLLVKQDEVIPESPAFVTSTRPAGVVAVTIGTGVTLTAVLMLVASHRGYKQRKAQARVELTPNSLRF